MNCTNNCTSCGYDCGTSGNPFKYLHEAILVLDKIIENDTETIARYPSIYSSFNASPSFNAHNFLLSEDAPHSLDFPLLNSSFPCDPNDCFYRFHDHNLTSTNNYSMGSYGSGQAQITVSTVRVMFYTNYYFQMEFQKLG